MKRTTIMVQTWHEDVVPVRAGSRAPGPGSRGSRTGGRAWRALAVLMSAVSAVSACSAFGASPSPAMSGGYQIQSDGSPRWPNNAGPMPSTGHATWTFTDDGCRETAKLYFRLVAYAWNKGDASAITNASQPGCRACKDTASRIEDHYQRGDWATGAVSSDFTVTKVAQADAAVVGEGVYGVFMTYKFRTPDVYRGGRLTRCHEETQSVVVRLAWSGHNWLVQEIEDQPQEES